MRKIAYGICAPTAAAISIPTPQDLHNKGTFFVKKKKG